MNPVYFPTSGAKDSKQLHPDLLVFSHLRWDFVFQRPQHLLTRFAKTRRVFFFEEPRPTDALEARYEKYSRQNGVQVVVPFVPRFFDADETQESLREIVDELIQKEEMNQYTAWYYTPMAMPFTNHLTPDAVVFDCMDELSAFKNAPANMIEWENELMKVSDVVFTGGYSLYEAKQHRHSNIFPFPSSIDREHFKKARVETEPKDQASIPHPRLGFYGVIDERMDLELLENIAKLRPNWHLVMIGPVVKIEVSQLPKLPNIHYLGKKDYQELPKYLAGWDLAILPFARNESTKFISPTKTPEYLAAGRPVVSTSIKDVIRPYAEEMLVSIADTADEFVKKAEAAMHQARHEPEWLLKVDEFLENMSWDLTFAKMSALEAKARQQKNKSAALSESASAEMRI